MSTVFFKPWIGADYESGWKGIRTLVLGESHYEWEEDKSLTPTLTIGCIEEQIQGDYTKQFWTNIVVAFLGKRPTLEEKRSFWQSVAFYNYIQESVGFGARVRPNTERWRNAKKPFSEILAKLKPQFLVVMGKQVWYGLPDFDGYYGPSIEGAPTPKTWIYPLSETETCLTFPLRHPSAGFSGRTLHPFLIEAHSVAASLTRPSTRRRVTSGPAKPGKARGGAG